MRVFDAWTFFCLSFVPNPELLHQYLRERTKYSLFQGCGDGSRAPPCDLVFFFFFFLLSPDQLLFLVRALNFVLLTRVRSAAEQSLCAPISTIEEASVISEANHSRLTHVAG